MRVLLVVNAFASSVTARNTVVVQRLLGEGNEVEVRETNRRGHATRFAQDAARRKLDAVIAFGGDGTLNEVATGVAGTRTALGVLPGGSTNVFARTLGMANDPLIAARQLAAGLAAGDLRKIGLGKVNGRYFCFHTGVGYDAAVVRQVERRASLKRWLGHPLFMYAATKTFLFGYDRAAAHFTVSSAGRDDAAGYFTIVMNTNPYTFLGNRPLNLSPDAGFDRGLVAVTFTSLRLGALVRGLGGALRGCGVTAGDSIDVRTDLSALTITNPVPFPYQMDGDYLGESSALTFEHVPNAVRLVMPGPP